MIVIVTDFNHFRFFSVIVTQSFSNQTYEVIGESINCTANAPIELNYTCKLERIDNKTQYWSFEGNVPDGLILPEMMVSEMSFFFFFFHLFAVRSYYLSFIRNC